MGLVLLDLFLRIERAFQLRLPRDLWLEKLIPFESNGRKDATLLQVHEFLLQQCAEQNVSAPKNSWSLLVQLVEEASGLKRSEITPNRWLVRDIAPNG
jgi:hypothetical protein